MTRIRSLISKFADRRDIWGSPMKALARNLAWNRHWRRSTCPYLVLANWREGITLALPETSNSKLAFCGRHPESAVLSAMNAHLFPGAVFVDVGAHVGVYSILAAKLVGSHGKVVAIEPQAVGVASIKVTAALNGFANLQLFHGAAGSSSGQIPLDAESFGAAVADLSHAGKNSTLVDCLSLDDLSRDSELKIIHLLKLDAAGNEAEVIVGAEKLLRSRQLQAIAMKLYRPDIVRHRFGKLTSDAVALLHSHGYKTTVVFHGRMIELQSIDDLESIFLDGSYCHLLLAQPK
jgi:FkbM family methyltransferase